MSVDALQPLGSLVDPYLRQAAPLLQTYWNAVYEITNQKLVLQAKALPPPEPDVDQIVQITIHISVPVVFPVVVERQGSGIVRARQHSGNASNQVKSNEEALYLIELLTLYNHKLQEVVKLELLAVQELSGDGPLSRKVKKLTELKKSLDEFTKVLEKITICYTTKSLGRSDVNLPSLEDLKVVKEKVCNMKKHLKQDELSSLFAKHNEKFSTSYENIFCAILGLRDELGSRLFELDHEMKMHQSLMYFIENFIESEENLVKGDEYFEEAGRDGLIKNLQKIGFVEERARVIAESIPDDLIDTQLPSYWAIKHLDFAVLYHPLLTSLPRYPFKDDEVQDEWFDENIPIDERSEPEDFQGNGRSDWPVRMINLSTKEGETKVNEFLKDQGEDKDYELLFHGTCHASAVSILNSGIKLGEGKVCQDFSSGDGFYLSELFENAKMWKRDGATASHQAVIVFKVRKDFVDPDKEDGLDVSGNREEWERIVRLCRTNYKDAKQKKKLLKGVTFIRGPLCRNPKDAGTKKPLIGFGRDTDIQFCIRDEDYAEAFGSIQNIACVIFY